MTDAEIVAALAGATIWWWVVSYGPGSPSGIEVRCTPEEYQELAMDAVQTRLQRHPEKLRVRRRERNYFSVNVPSAPSALESQRRAHEVLILEQLLAGWEHRSEMDYYYAV